MGCNNERGARLFSSVSGARSGISFFRATACWRLSLFRQMAWIPSLSDPKSLYQRPSALRGSASATLPAQRSSREIFRSFARSNRCRSKSGGRFRHWIVGTNRRKSSVRVRREVALFPPGRWNAGIGPRVRGRPPFCLRTRSRRSARARARLTCRATAMESICAAMSAGTGMSIVSTPGMVSATSFQSTPIPRRRRPSAVDAVFDTSQQCLNFMHTGRRVQ